MILLFSALKDATANVVHPSTVRATTTTTNTTADVEIGFPLKNKRFR